VLVYFIDCLNEVISSQRHTCFNKDTSAAPLEFSLLPRN